jgi:hypothetical protein
VVETVAGPLKHYYEQEQVWGKKEARSRISSVWDKKIDQNWIDKLVTNYPDRLKTCRDIEGRMTKW